MLKLSDERRHGLKVAAAFATTIGVFFFGGVYGPSFGIILALGWLNHFWTREKKADAKGGRVDWSEWDTKWFGVAVVLAIIVVNGNFSRIEQHRSFETDFARLCDRQIDDSPERRLCDEISAARESAAETGWLAPTDDY